MTDELLEENEITKVDFTGGGMSFCHKVQGGPSNGRPQQLLVKSEDKDIPEEALQAIEKITGGVDPEVRLETSMFDLLRKWMGMYWDDADALARMLGYEGAGGDADQWVEDKIQEVTLLKDAGANNHIPYSAKQSHIKELSDFIEKSGLKLESSSEGATPQDVDSVDGGGTITKSATPSNETKTSKGEIMSEKDVELEKSVTELQKSLKALEKAAADKDEKIQALEKARADEAEAALMSTVEGFSFVAEDEREALVKSIQSADAGTLLLSLHKAQTAIVEALGEQALPADDAESVIKSKSAAGVSAVEAAMKAINA